MGFLACDRRTSKSEKSKEDCLRAWNTESSSGVGAVIAVVAEKSEDMRICDMSLEI